jgi:hypothetical protein
MRTARTKLVDDAYTAVAASPPRPPAPQPDSLIADEPARPRHAFPTEAVA